MTARRIPLARPDLGELEIDAVAQVLRSGWVTQGPTVAQFEAAFASIHGVDYAVACSSGTAALHLALLALGIGAGDEVIVPSFTWIASANAVLYCGATPVLADIDPVTYNLTPETIRPCLSERTRAVMPVHMFGLPADVTAIRAALSERVFIVEDAACAAGGRAPAGMTGSLGDVAAFSFHPRKSITTGEGGMVTTMNPAVADRVRAFRNHGAVAPKSIDGPWVMSDFPMVGFNYRMSDILAAVGSVQLGKLDGYIAERARLAEGYARRLGNLGWLALPGTPAGYRHAWQSYVVSVRNPSPVTRNEAMRRLAAAGVETRPGTHAIHLQACYRERFGLHPDAFPYARDAAEQSFALPLYAGLTEDDQDYIAATLLAA